LAPPDAVLVTSPGPEIALRVGARPADFFQSGEPAAVIDRPTLLDHHRYQLGDCVHIEVERVEG
jgi:hypothetical protein